MNSEEAKRVADERRLIVENLVNGVEPNEVARAFRRSRDDVMRDFDFAARKIKSYCFERRLPAFLVSTLGQARQQKQVFLHFLDRISFATDPKFRKIGVEFITEDNMRFL